ncbi:GNAT family N-acetyltransferase [Aquimarina sp. 2201CG1-2-11]|uniref:GNAT family N-acetyltransferase n=1 Tax=Aquimarina discodermiae TaxID=3231043 RepID=UPI003461ACC1
MKHSFVPFPTLVTQRLQLRETIDEDHKGIFFLRSDVEVNKYIDRPVPKSMKDVEDFVQMINKGTENGENINWTITLKEEPTKMIGSICLWNFSEDGKVAEVGYVLHPTFQNRGIMTEAMQSTIEYGFKNLKLDKIEAYTHRDNESSKYMLLKNGFTLVENKKDKDFPDNIILEIQNTAI